MKAPKGFRISIGDDSEHDDLTAEVYHREKFVAILTQEQGYERIEIEIHPPPRCAGDKWCFPLKDFLEAIESAKKRLWELRKIPPTSDR